MWLRKLGGAKPGVSQDGGGIISAGRAIRSDRGDKYYYCSIIYF